MSKKRRVLTFIAALTLYALTMPISAFATNTIKVGSGDEFRQAARTVNTNRHNKGKKPAKGGVPISHGADWGFACVRIDLRAFELPRGR